MTTAIQKSPTLRALYQDSYMSALRDKWTPSEASEYARSVVLGKLRGMAETAKRIAWHVTTSESY